MENEPQPPSTKPKSRSGEEVDYKTKSGTAWSHNFLNQKPWHPLSYPNQRRKWIAEQTDAQRQRRSEEVAREFAQEQDFLRQTALVSKKEREKMEIMKAVSFMYVRPPGYNAESAKAAEVADQGRLATPEAEKECGGGGAAAVDDKKKSRPKDVFGRSLPTEEEFEVLKNAPRLETGMPARVKPFAVEIRNVRCVRCGTFGHQSGDRECPMKDKIMPNDESRLKRDDPLNAIMAQTDTAEPLKWELKQIPGMSPPRGGFKPDDPNQQIVAEDIFDEYGGFLSGGDIPSLLTEFKKNKSKKHSGKKSKQKHHSTSTSSDADDEKEKRTSKGNHQSRRHEKSDHDRQHERLDHDRKREESDHDRRHEKSDNDRRHEKLDHERRHERLDHERSDHDRWHCKKRRSYSRTSDGSDSDHYHRRRRHRKG